MLRMQGQIGNDPSQILVDIGSTHNFIQHKFNHILQQPVIPTIFEVLVENGEVLHCIGVYYQLKFKVICFLLTIICFKFKVQM